MLILWLCAALLLGLLVGSFLNVVLYRFPIMLMAGWRQECEEFLSDKGETQDKPQKKKEAWNLAFPRSHCPSCKKLIPAWCNIPVASYLILKGKCLNCKTPISLRYPFVELLTGIITAFSVFYFGLTIQAALFIAFSWMLISLSFIDIDHQLLPDSMTLPLLWAGLVANAFGLFTDLNSAVFGAVFGYMSLWTVYWVFKLLTGKEGMGFGDFKLLAALGAWMGWQSLPTVIILSSLVGAIIGTVSIVARGQGKNTKIEAMADAYLQFVSP
jgi:leader peptidase (prepilin peptidase)/N-methyltransferase